MEKIEHMALIRTKGKLDESFFDSFGDYEADFGVADVMQQAFLTGAATVIGELNEIISADDVEPKMQLIRVLEKIGMLSAEIQEFDRLRDAAHLSAPVGDGSH